MATMVEPKEQKAPLSLYIALQPNSRADLEVIGRASVAWAKMIQEAAFLVDPFAEVRVELVSGTESSINLNSLLNSIRGLDRRQLKAIGISVAIFFGTQAVGWGTGKIFDAMWEWARIEIPEFVESLTELEMADVEELVARLTNSNVTQEKARVVYAELSKDEKITGVGVSFQPGERPRDIVPRSEFATRAGTPALVEESVPRRIETERVSLTLMAPALSDEDHKWKFRRGTKTVWAHMTDPDFRARVAPGSNSAPPMLIGIVMEVDLETTQEFENGVWTVVDQHVTKVHSLRPPPSQNSWLDSTP